MAGEGGTATFAALFVAVARERELCATKQAACLTAFDKRGQITILKLYVVLEPTDED